MLKSLDSSRADGAQATSDLQIDGFESVAKELSEVPEAIEAEAKHACKRVGTHHGDRNQRPNQTWDGADAIHDHSRDRYQPAW